MEGNVGVLGAGREIEALGGADGMRDGGEDALVKEEGEAEREGFGMEGRWWHGAASELRVMEWRGVRYVADGDGC